MPHGKIIGGHYASLDLGLPFQDTLPGGRKMTMKARDVEDAIAVRGWE